MARPRKADPITLVMLVDRFYEEEADGNPNRIKATRLEEFAAKKGYEFKEYDFRRCKAVRERIQELKESYKGFAGDSTSAAYKTLDVEGIIKRCATLDDLRQALTDMDQYWKEIYEITVEKSKECKRHQSERDKYLEEIQKLKKQNTELQGNVGTLRTENNKLGRENTYLRSMIRKYLYPNVVREILKEDNIPVEENTAVKTEMINQYVEGSKPLPFTGIQREAVKKPSRSERLIENLKRQVNDE